MPEQDATHVAASTISREIVGLYARLYGRGPTKVNTHIDDDYVLCVLEDILTPAEETLIAGGKGTEVEKSRTAFQDAISREFKDVVEGACGRSVRAFISDVHLEQSMAIELFIF